MRDRLLAITSHRATLPLIIVLCLTLRLGLSFTLSDTEIKHDAELFIQIAQNIADGKGFTLDDGSGTLRPSAYGFVVYPYFLAAMTYGLPDANLLAISVAQSIIDTLTCFLVFALALRVTSNRLAAVFAALLYCVYPPFLFCTTKAVPEITSTAILFGAAFLLFSAFRGSKWRFALAGAAMGVAILARPSLLLFPLFLGLVMCLKRREIGGWPANAAIYAVAAYLVVSPWTIRNYRVFRAFVPVTTNMGMVLWGSTGPYDGKCLAPFYPMAVAGQDRPDNPLIAVVSESTYRKIEKLKAETDSLDEVTRDAVLKRAAIQEIKEHPGRFALLAVKKPFRLWFNLWGDFPISAASYAMAALNIVLLALALLAFRRPGVDYRFKIMAAAMLIYITLVTTGTCTGMRYSYTFMPFVIILAASFVCGSRYKHGADEGAVT